MPLTGNEPYFKHSNISRCIVGNGRPNVGRGRPHVPRNIMAQVRYRPWRGSAAHIMFFASKA